MHIVFISAPYPPHSRGGIGSYVHTIAHALAEAGHSIQVIARCPLGEDHEAWDGPVHVHWVGPFVIRALWRRPLRWLRLYETFPAVGDWIGWSVAAARKVRQLDRQQRVDLVEAPDHLAQGYAATFLDRIPVIVRIHSPLAVNLPAKGEKPQKDHWLGFRFERWAALRASTLTAPSRWYAGFMRSFWRLGSKPILVAPNPVDELRFRPAPDERRRANLVSYIGRLNRAKGVPVFLAAIPRILERVPTACFRLVGLDEGDAPHPAGTYERFFLQEYGPAATQAVQFLPWVDSGELPRYYQESLIAVAPSVGPDNFPIAVAEAMSCGCAVVASRIGGIPEIIEHDESGILVPPGDSEQLAAAIIRLLERPELAKAMGRRARQVVEQRYARAAVVEQMLAIYRQTIAEKTHERDVA